MKNIFFILLFIFYINCGEYILKAGTRTNGYCSKNNYFFSFENSYFLESNSLKIQKEFTFTLLMENNIFSKCKINDNKNDKSKNLAIFCKIKNYIGCFQKYPKIPKLGLKEPQKIIMKNGDIIHFEGFSRKTEKNKFFFTRNHFKNNLLYENEILTLKAGVLKKDDNNNNDKFIIENNTIIERDISVEEKKEIEGMSINLKIKINNEDNIYEAICKFEIISNININIICNINNKNGKTVETIYIVENPKQNKLLSFIGYKELTLYTVALGNIWKAQYSPSNFVFYLKGTTISKQIKKNKSFSLPIEIKGKKFNSVCKIKKGVIKYDSYCYIKDYCPNNNLDIKIENKNFYDYNTLKPNTIYFNVPKDISTSTLKDLGDIIYDPNRIFLGESNIINIIGGTLHKIKYEKENKKYYFSFNNSEINDLINIDIPLNITIKVNDVQKLSSCNLEKNTNNIICSIEIDESNKVELVILENPKDNIESIPDKTIAYTNFMDKKLYTTVGGIIEKGKCEDNNYIFYFRNSSTIIFDQAFYLQMKYPKEIATCNIIPDLMTETKDIKCVIIGTSACPIEYEDSNIIVGDSEPDPIQLNEAEIVYFSSFAGKNTFTYKVSVGILKKGEIDTEKCIYNFEFKNEEPFEFDFFNKDITFNFNMNLAQFKFKSKCHFYEV